MQKRNRNLRVSQVAEILNISCRQVYRLASDGHFEVFRIGARGLRITEKSLKQFIDRRKKIEDYERGILDAVDI